MKWLRDPADWFESRMPDCFELVSDSSVEEALRRRTRVYFTYEMRIIRWDSAFRDRGGGRDDRRADRG